MAKEVQESPNYSLVERQLVAEEYNEQKQMNEPRDKTSDLGAFIFVTGIGFIYFIFLGVQKFKQGRDNKLILGDISSADSDDYYHRDESSNSNDSSDIAKDQIYQNQKDMDLRFNNDPYGPQDVFQVHMHQADLINASTSDLEGDFDQNFEGQPFENAVDNTLQLGDDSIIFQNVNDSLISQPYQKDDGKRASRSNVVNLLEQLNLDNNEQPSYLNNNHQQQNMRYGSQINYTPNRNHRRPQVHEMFDSPQSKMKKQPESPIKPYITDKFRNRISQISSQGAN